MTWNTANVLAVFLDCDIWVHHQYFFGNIHSFPVVSPMGTSQSHNLEHCECTVHVPAGVITCKLSGKFKMYLQCSKWVHCWDTVHFLVMYLQYPRSRSPPISDQPNTLRSASIASTPPKVAPIRSNCGAQREACWRERCPPVVRCRQS